MFSVQMVFCHKRGRVTASVSVQLTSHWSPENKTKKGYRNNSVKAVLRHDWVATG